MLARRGGCLLGVLRSSVCSEIVTKGVISKNQYWTVPQQFQNYQLWENWSQFSHLQNDHYAYQQMAYFTRMRKRRYKGKGKEPKAVRISGSLAQKWIARFRVCKDGTILRYRAGYRHRRFHKSKRQLQNLRKIVPVTKQLNKWLRQLGLKWFRKKYPRDYMEKYPWPITNPSHALRIYQLGDKYKQQRVKQITS
eukprot:TRINITY_DN6425_c0_g1_i2.p1 TRINITY_DN6425_c0_g1~~TRINITY_DN6425_c0_g1_i2.p1  ORF type:complete len:194 (-),score=8.24 TRINITY_DN6425_c0_g1_i2:179-760(-)